MMNCKIFFVYVVVTALAACSGGSQKTQSDIDQDSLTEQIGKNTKAEFATEVIDGLVESIPSPLEMSTAIKEAGAEFNKSILNPTENVDNYKTTLKQAANLGIYGADLAYINIYEKTYSSLEYLNVIRDLSSQLKVGEFFDFQHLKNLATNSKNVDSLIYLSTSSFNNMDAYLRKQKRSNLSVMMVVGAWVEAVHIATQVVKEAPSKAINEKIGEQQITLNNIMLILDIYKQDPAFAEVIKECENLKKELDKVSITYVYNASETKEVNGQLVIVDNSTTEVKITDQNVTDITAAVQKLREKLIH